MQKINISWEGPFSIEDIIDGTIDKLDCKVKSNDIGLYQIYGSHPLYGDGILVYIGRTMNKNGFKSRLKDRWVINHGTDSKNVKIYLGTMFSDNKTLSKVNNRDEIEDMIEKAEVLLINAMKPAFNSSNIQSAKIFDEDFIVYNHNSYRSLYPILDTNYFWNDFKNIDIVDKIAKELGIDNKIINSNEFYGFDLKTNDNICFGVDYNYWDNREVPLIIGIYKEVVNKKLKSILEKEFSDIDCDEEYYLISACNDLDNDNAIKDIESKILRVEALLEKS